MGIEHELEGILQRARYFESHYGHMKNSPFTLGIWDGHDAGAALLRDNKVLFAINEERLSRRKLEVGFPFRSIAACLEGCNLRPGDISTITCSTSDFSKTLTRLFPGLKERHYLIRRRKIKPGLLQKLKLFKFWITTWGTSPILKTLSLENLKGSLKKLGFSDYTAKIVDHHQAHAACAAFFSPFRDALVITLDGVGDGLSGSISAFENGALRRIAAIPSRNSLGIFFEQVTYLLNMRELEDEGKVMALSDYSHEIPPEANPMRDLFLVDGMRIKALYSPAAMFRKLSDLLWQTPWETFSRMAQDVLEACVIGLVRNGMKSTGKQNLAWCGGVASNIKLNMKIRHLEEVKGWYVFPHMGDGGLALGAAVVAAHENNGMKEFHLPGVYLGPEYDEKHIKALLERENIRYRYEDNIEAEVARLLHENNIVLWFQGRSEYGPRALGNRTILAPADSISCKEELNLFLKRRNWFQPFCPTILREDAEALIEDYDAMPSPFMTMAYTSRASVRDKIAAVIGKDGTLRPQILDNENPRYRTLLEEVKKLTGIGIVLNTSFNRHGEPMVSSPEDALKTFRETGVKYLVMGNFLVERGSHNEALRAKLAASEKKAALVDKLKDEER